MPHAPVVDLTGRAIYIPGDEEIVVSLLDEDENMVIDLTNEHNNEDESESESDQNEEELYPPTGLINRSVRQVFDDVRQGAMYQEHRTHYAELVLQEFREEHGPMYLPLARIVDIENEIYDNALRRFDYETFQRIQDERY